MGIKHLFTSAFSDSSDASQVRASNWNADHTIDGDVDFNGFDIVNAGNISGSWVNVKDYGAVGDGSTDDTVAINLAINAAFPTEQTSNYVSTDNKILFFPAGTYRITTVLTIRGLAGGVLMGVGKTGTTINNTAGGGCIRFDGIAYSTIKDIQFQTSGTGTGLSLDASGSFITTQGNLIESCAFQGGQYGCNVGNAGIQASENTFVNCHWFNNTTAGLRIGNFNALNNQVIGGNFQSCDIGILNQAGVAPVVHGVGFQLSTTCDIKFNNSANVAVSIAGCRTESTNFVQVAGFLTYAEGPYLMIVGCGQQTSTAGIFLDTHAGGSVDGCYSEAGTITFTTTPGLVSNSLISGTYHPSGGSTSIIGAQRTAQDVDGSTAKLQVTMAGSNLWTATLGAYLATSTGPSMAFFKSRNATAGSHTIVQADDGLGTIGVYGSNGTTFKEASFLSWAVDGTPGSGSDMPTRLALSLSKDGTASPADVLTVKNDGGMILGTNATSPGAGNIQIGTATHTFTDLPGSPAVGMIAYVSNSNTATHGATVAGGGANKILAWYNGTNWTVVGS